MKKSVKKCRILILALLLVMPLIGKRRYIDHALAVQNDHWNAI